MIKDLTISYVCDGIKTTLTIKDEHSEFLPYSIADMFEEVIRAYGANPKTIIDYLKIAFECE